MTSFERQIDTALRLIRQNGQPCAIRRERTTAPTTTIGPATYGDLSASGATFAVTSGDLTQVARPGDQVEVAFISAFANRGPFQVRGVSPLSLEIDGTLSPMSADSAWEMTITGSPVEIATSHAVLLPLSRSTLQRYDTALRDGSTQIGVAKDIIIAASGLTFGPKPGDRLQVGAAQWRTSAPSYSIVGMDDLAPDGTPIIYQGPVTRG